MGTAFRPVSSIWATTEVIRQRLGRKMVWVRACEREPVNPSNAMPAAGRFPWHAQSSRAVRLPPSAAACAGFSSVVLIASATVRNSASRSVVSTESGPRYSGRVRPPSNSSSLEAPAVSSAPRPLRSRWLLAMLFKYAALLLQPAYLFSQGG